MATPAFISPLRVRLAIKMQRLSSQNFVCRQCVHQKASQSTSKPYKSIRQSPYLNAFRRQQSSASAQQTASPLSALSQSIKSQPSSGSKRSSFPSTSHQSVAYWLVGSATSVFGLVVFGGLTRLTESGLSITEWRPVTGSLPPRNAADWDAEFAKYKLSPEFKMLNSKMGLEEFKSIYWMEWGHRLWGRVVGITFLVPTVYFIVRRRVSRAMAVRLVGISGLIGFQGMIGWWMVKSGLKDDLFNPGSHPRVSQYRLAAHLGTAFVAYLAMLWNGLAIFREHSLLHTPQKGLEHLSQLQSPALQPFRRAVLALAALTFTTALAGAFVAGLDGGLVYNNFPWMGDDFLPPKEQLLDPFYSHTAPDTNGKHPDLLWRNMLENPITAQLDHRILGTSTFTAVVALAAYARFHSGVRASLPPNAKKALTAVVGLVSLQVALGISTLWFLVPVWLGAAHQAGALALLSGVAVLGSRVSAGKRLLGVVARQAERSTGRVGGVGSRVKVV